MRDPSIPLAGTLTWSVNQISLFLGVVIGSIQAIENCGLTDKKFDTIPGLAIQDAQHALSHLPQQPKD